MNVAAPPPPAGREGRVRARMTLPGHREDSLKIEGGRITRGRVLMSFPRAALLPGPKTRLAALAADLGLDAGALLPHLAAASAVHVGFEADGRAKLYLEFQPAAAPQPGLVYLAVKHDHRINRYWREEDPAPLIAAAVPAGPMRAAALACLPYTHQVLKVEEEGSPRLSVDLNLTNAGMQVGHLPGLSGLMEGLREDLADISREPLDHYAAGTGRDGQPFATIYYGGRHDP